MQRYVSYSKILEDTRVLKKGHMKDSYAKRIRVLFFRKVLDSMCKIQSCFLDSRPKPDLVFHKMLSGTIFCRMVTEFSWGEVCLANFFYKKLGKNSRFHHFVR